VYIVDHINGKGDQLVSSSTNSIRWGALALIVTAQFMVILDVAIVNVALPSIKIDLGFSQADLQWVISAYAILFGGTLLLGGRLADLLGRRRLFVAGLVLFAASSLLCGVAWSEWSLVGFRAVQGLAGALLAPAALSLLMTSFARVAIGTSRSASTARRPEAAQRPACCWAASSPATSAGRGSSS
jgi:MFS family permease